MKAIPGKYVVLQNPFGDWKQTYYLLLNYFLNIIPMAWGFTVCPREVLDELRMIDERDERFMRIHRLYQSKMSSPWRERKVQRIRNKAFLMIFWIGIRERKHMHSDRWFNIQQPIDRRYDERFSADTANL